jgi:hypothetical protein
MREKDAKAMPTQQTLKITAILICCAGLAACTATATKGPDTSVTTPSVGTPPPPDSVEAALAKEAFTPYAELGESVDDGLAPNESDSALGAACMAAAGYPNDGNDVPASFRISEGLAFAPPWGQWGYVGIAQAEQYGFFPGPGLLGVTLHLTAPPGQGFASLSGAAQTVAGKCASIVMSFGNAQLDGSLAGIQTLANDIYNDVLRHPAVKAATKAWVACMAKNGYDFPDPMTAFRKTLLSVNNGSGRITPASGQSLQKNQAQIAAAVTDADCTQSTDLAGIYFAVQASYEQQIVDLNQQQLDSAVQQYRAAYHAEIGKLSPLLKTASTAAPYIVRPASPAAASSPAGTPHP